MKRTPAVHASWCVLAIAVAAACAIQPDASASEARLVVGVPALRIGAPVLLARDRGLFRAEGLDVDLRTYETAQPMLDDVALGRLDAAGFAAWPIVLAASSRASEPLRTVASVVEDRDHRISYVLRRHGSTLRFPGDARGKTIGILPTVAYRRWLEAILHRASVDPAEVTLLPIAPPMQAQALSEGGVDLLFTGDPMATAMISSGHAEIADDGPPCAMRIANPFDFGTFVISGATARRSPDAVRRLVRALDRAIAIADRDPRAARDALTSVLRPTERAWIDRYPATRFRASRATSMDLAGIQAERASREGTFEGRAHIVAWRP